MPICIGPLFAMVPEICSLSYVADVPVAECFEEVNSLLVSLMVSECSVCSDERHIPPLPFACVVISPVRLELVTVPVLCTTLTCKEEDDWMIAWRGHPTLPLASETIVEIAPPIVDFAYLKLHSVSGMMRAA